MQIAVLLYKDRISDPQKLIKSDNLLSFLEIFRLKRKESRHFFVIFVAN